MKRQVVQVNESGLDENGEGFDIAATSEAITAGWMVNVPVTLVFPDGRKMDTNRAELTPRGLNRLAQILPVTGGAA